MTAFQFSAAVTTRAPSGLKAVTAPLAGDLSSSIGGLTDARQMRTV